MTRAKKPHRYHQAGQKSALSSCLSKRKYPTKKLADATGEYQSLLDGNIELSSYNCGGCGKWHLTRQARLV